MQNGSKILRIVGLGLAGVGLIFILVSGGIFYFSYTFIERAVRTNGTVVDFASRRSSSTSSSNSNSNLLYYPLVRFETESGEQVTFESPVGSRPAAYEVGQTVAVLYDPAAPREATIDSFSSLWLTATIFGSLGVVLSIAGAGFLWFVRRARVQADWLVQNGMKVAMNVDRVELNRSVRVNGQHPYRIICRGTDPFSGLAREFRSENLYFDPEPLLEERLLDVWLAPRNPKRYRVDVEPVKKRRAESAADVPPTR